MPQTWFVIRHLYIICSYLAYIQLKDGKKLNLIDKNAYETDAQFPVLAYTTESVKYCHKIGSLLLEPDSLEFIPNNFRPAHIETHFSN